MNTERGSKGEELGAVFFISLAAHLTPGTQAEARELQPDQISEARAAYHRPRDLGETEAEPGEVPGLSSMVLKQYRRPYAADNRSTGKNEQHFR